MTSPEPNVIPPKVLFEPKCGNCLQTLQQQAPRQLHRHEEAFHVRCANCETALTVPKSLWMNVVEWHRWAGTNPEIHPICTGCGKRITAPGALECPECSRGLD